MERTGRACVELWTNITRGLASTAQRVVRHMCEHYSFFSRLENLVNGLRRRYRRWASGANRETDRKRKALRHMDRLAEGRYVCCVWERMLKPFAVKMVKVVKVSGGGLSGGMSEVTLENGIRFRATAAKTKHLFQDKERLANALEAPTRANVLIFTHGYEALKHLRNRGCEGLGKDMDFEMTDRDFNDTKKKGS